MSFLEGLFGKNKPATPPTSVVIPGSPNMTASAKAPADVVEGPPSNNLVGGRRRKSQKAKSRNSKSQRKAHRKSRRQH